MELIGRLHLNITYMKKEEKMITKLLKKTISLFSHDHNKKKIEKYLSQSKDLTDLENRMKELDERGIYNKLYI